VVQFWTDVVWDETDIMFIDMPPGTGDVPLSVFQSIPLSGVIVVTTPQDLVEMIVKKAVNMAEKMNVPLLGVAENMSYLTCPCCGTRLEPFGASKAGAIAMEYRTEVARIPMSSDFARLADAGRIFDADTSALDGLLGKILCAREIRNAKR